MCPESSLCHPQQHLNRPKPYLGKNSAASSHETPWSKSCLTGESLCQLVIWELPRTAGIPTFKAEAPRTTKECLEDIVCIKFCGARWEQRKRWKKVFEGEHYDRIGRVSKAFADSIISLGSQNFRLEVSKSAPPYAYLTTWSHSWAMFLSLPKCSPKGEHSLPQPSLLALSSPQLGMPIAIIDRLSPHCLPILLGLLLKRLKFITYTLSRENNIKPMSYCICLILCCLHCIPENLWFIKAPTRCQSWRWVLCIHDTI